MNALLDTRATTEGVRADGMDAVCFNSNLRLFYCNRRSYAGRRIDTIPRQFKNEKVKLRKRYLKGLVLYL